MLVALLVFTKLSSTAHAAWWNDSWLYRKLVSVTNSSGGTLTNYQVSFTMDTATLITAGKMQSTCADLRVADTVNGNSLPYWIEESGTGACNTSTTRIWTIVGSLPTTGASIYVYYGNPAASSGQNPSAVFPLYDTFSGSAVDTTKWTSTGTPTVASGAVSLSNGAGLVSTTTQTSAAGLGRLIFAAKQAATNLTGGKIGFSNTQSSATNFHADQAAAFIAGSTNEQINQTGGANLVAHYQLEETTSTDANQFKASGYLDTGKLSQAVSMYGNAAGTAGSTLTFNRGAQISGNNFEHINTNQGTISFWAYPTSSTSSILQLASGVPVTSATGAITANNFTAPVYYVNGKLTTTPILTAGTWNHIVVTTGTGITANAIKFALVGSTYYAGQIDDVRVYNYALTGTQVKTLYNENSSVRFGPLTGSP